MTILSVIVPCYNEADCIESFHKRITETLGDSSRFDYELIYIDDGSKDNTVEKLKLLSNNDVRVVVVELSRNFGKESALTAGLKVSKGDMVVPIDADLQHPPEIILKMVDCYLGGGIDVVIAMRKSRSTESSCYRLATKWFYKIENFISNAPVPPKDAGDFRLMSRKVVDSLNSLPETQRYMKGLYAWVGYKCAFVPYEVDERLAGESKFSATKLIALAANGLLDFSVFPLRLWLGLGTLFSFVGFIYAIWIIFNTFIYGIEVPGYASIISSILLIGGIQLISIGVVGEYVGRLYIEVKARPSYIVKKITRASANV